ncbi:hypothetical protein SNOG_09612 [Parastagonospora nodorum SN15]|uniref:Uncharacterized protein n=1 Tax=Phaeosphaeria nodorum (strain SN15 / ATCC MYA-4574 / FGSC 10173) TaxID=321614 RepID=Q0UF52_PHANO|nr:hypothetical protein SNOG_09612 [Parastagonospora nodorum SN15]EAT82877.1 hypothetical protein SNOG_09612 [Parastagonospora nodorum SN15]
MATMPNGSRIASHLVRGQQTRTTTWILDDTLLVGLTWTRRFGAEWKLLGGKHNSRRALATQGGGRSEMSHFCRISAGRHGK